jgi:hypothetical protein
MNYKLLFTSEADAQLRELEGRPDRVAACKAVKKALGYMEVNLRHPSLHTHVFTTIKGPNGQKVFESYAQNRISGAYRIFWYYGVEDGIIVIAAIVRHPDR